MTRLLSSFLTLALLSMPSWADITASKGALAFSSDSGNKVVSVATGTPTQILSNDPYVTRTYLVNRSTWVSIVISTSSTENISNGIFILPQTTFSPDGPTVPWWGQLFAICSGTGTFLPVSDCTVSVFRTK